MVRQLDKIILPIEVSKGLGERHKITHKVV